VVVWIGDSKNSSPSLGPASIGGAKHTDMLVLGAGTDILLSPILWVQFLLTWSAEKHVVLSCKRCALVRPGREWALILRGRILCPVKAISS